MSPSFAILKQALADDAFEGGEVACFGDHSVSWNTRENIVAIADSCGWWVMPAHTLKAIAAATPNNRDEPTRESAGTTIGTYEKATSGEASPEKQAQ